MKRDPLPTVLRVRRLAMEDATRDLAECLRGEAEAQHAVAAVEAAIHRETEAASSLSADDSVVEAFGMWLKRARKDLHNTQARREHCESETARARAALAVARAAVRATEHLIEKQAAVADAEAARKEQAALDEVGQRTRSHAPVEPGSSPTAWAGHAEE
jgi:flagellar export protein FliJ